VHSTASNPGCRPLRHESSLPRPFGLFAVILTMRPAPASASPSASSRHCLRPPSSTRTHCASFDRFEAARRPAQPRRRPCRPSAGFPRSSAHGPQRAGPSGRPAASISSRPQPKRFCASSRAPRIGSLQELS
jgi:hypothetical protein